MLFIIGASGKLGLATLIALLDHNLIPAEQIACTTSSKEGEARLTDAKKKGVQVRSAAWDDTSEHWEKTLAGCTKLFLISSARIEKDFGTPHPANGQGREEDHVKVLHAAVNIGVQHIYYTSLAFANPSKSRVMTAHERTERWLQEAAISSTLIREGLYNESWPLYLGHYDIQEDQRAEIVVSGDSKISWTSISDLGLATAMILAAPSQDWDGKTLYLSQEKAHSLAEVAFMVSKARGQPVQLKVTSRGEYESYYIDRGFSEGMIKWWARTYDALRENECEIHDPTLEKLLKLQGVTPTKMEETITAMLAE